MKYRRLLSGMAILVILVVTVIAFNYRQVEAQMPQTGPNVTIAGPLPLPVSDAGPRQPFQMQLDDDNSTPEPSSLTLPNNRRLTIELVTMFCTSSAAATPAAIMVLSTSVGGPSSNHFFFPKFVRTAAQNIYGTSENVRVYGGPGTEVSIVGSGVDCNVTISGFLEPI